MTVISANIDFFIDSKRIDSLVFEPATIDVAQQRYYRKHLNTSNFRPGDYTAIAFVDTDSFGTPVLPLKLVP